MRMGGWARLRRDPRYPQLLVLTSLLLYGVGVLDFALPLEALLITPLLACTAEAAQFRFRRAQEPARPRPPYESALISSLSLMLLLRSNEAWVYAVAVLVAVGSKVLVRVQGRHVFNPTNLAVLFAATALPGWITGGQWGHGVLFAFALSGAGALVLSRAERLDSAAAFMGGWILFGALRVLIFGYRWPVLWHQLESGALWIFALYMITDPKTTPRRRAMRVVHGALVALIAVVLLQVYYVRDSFLWALLATSPAVVLLNAVGARPWGRRERRPSGGMNASIPIRP